MEINKTDSTLLAEKFLSNKPYLRFHSKADANPPDYFQIMLLKSCLVAKFLHATKIYCSFSPVLIP